MSRQQTHKGPRRQGNLGRAPSWVCYVHDATRRICFAVHALRILRRHCRFSSASAPGLGRKLEFPRWIHVPRTKHCGRVDEKLCSNTYEDGELIANRFMAYMDPGRNFNQFLCLSARTRRKASMDTAPTARALVAGSRGRANMTANWVSRVRSSTTCSETLRLK
jgi:hypothetical protein